MTITEALKKLYKSLGGEADTAEITSLVELLNLIAELYGGEPSDTIAGAIVSIAEGYENSIQILSSEQDSGEDDTSQDEEKSEGE